MDLRPFDWRIGLSRQRVWFVLGCIALTSGCRTIPEGSIAAGSSGFEPAKPIPSSTIQGRTQSPIHAVAFHDEPKGETERIVSPDPGLDDSVSTETGKAESLEPPFESRALADLLAGSVPSSVDAEQTSSGVLEGIESTPITLEEVVQGALAMHPELVKARASVDVARGRYQQAGLPYNPTLQYQSEEIGNEETTGLHSINVTQRFVTANKLSIAQRVEAQEIQRRQAIVEFAQLRVVTRVRTRFVNAWVAQQRLVLAEQITELAEEATESVKELLKAEEVSRRAFLQAKVELQQARLAQENSRVEEVATRRALAAAMGLPELREARLAAEFSETLTEMPWQTLLDELTFASPELATASAEIQRAKWSLSLACSQVTPDVTGQVGVGYDASTDDTFATVGVSVPLPIRNRNQGNIRAARAKVSQANAAIDQKRLDLNARLASTMAEYQKSLQQLRHVETEILPIAEETYELSREAFDAGETAYLQLLTAQRTLFTTRIRLLEAAASARLASARIDGWLVDQLQDPT